MAGQKYQLYFADQYRTFTLKKIASYFKAPYDKLSESTEEVADNIFYCPKLHEAFGFADRLFPVHQNKLNFSEITIGRKLLKSDLFEFFVNGEALLDDRDKDNFRLIYHLKTTGIHRELLVMFRADEYDGLGGVFVEADRDNLFVIEPIENYLRYNYDLSKFSEDVGIVW